MLATPILAAALALTQSVPGEGAVPCSGYWVPAFGPTYGVDGPVNALLDLGGETIAGGAFTSAGGVPAANVARFDGESWHALGAGLGAEVRALAVLGTPENPRIFAGGSFQALPGSQVPLNAVAEFNGQSWSAPGGGFGGVTVDFERWPEGPTESLLALNQVFSPQGDTLWRVGRYDGSNWESISPLHVGTAQRVVVNDDGTGRKIYVIGQGLVGLGTMPHRILVWDGASWQPTGNNVPTGDITAVTTFDWGQGSRLTVAGQLPGATVATLSIAYLEGNQWLHTPVTTQPFGTSYSIRALAPLQLQPGGPVELFGAGRLDLTGQYPTSGLFRWEAGAFVNVLDSGGVGVRTLERVVSAEGDRLLMGGSGLNFLGLSLRNVGSYSPLGVDAFGEGLSGTVRDIAVRQTPGGPELYIAGGPLSIGSKPLGDVGRFANGEWTSLIELGGSTSLVGEGEFQRLFVDEQSPTQDIYIASNLVRRYNGSSWAQLGATFGLATTTSLSFFEPTGGPRQLFAGLRRNGQISSWQPMQRYVNLAWQPLFSAMNGSVDALCVFDDGSGPALYIGGDFTQLDGQPAKSLVRYDGSGWMEVGAGLSGPVKAMAVYDSGDGPKLHVAGPFLFADGQFVNRIARLDGGAWSPLAGGVSGDVQSLVVHTSAGRSLLVAAGVILEPNNQTPAALALWDGEQWIAPSAPLPGGQLLTARSYLWPGDLEPTLHVGGTFTALGSNGDSYFTRWGCPQQAPLVNPIPSCQPSAVALASSASFAPLGGTLPLAVSASATSDAALVLLGAPFTAGKGCGLALVGLGELWLDPLQTITLVAVGAPLLGSFETTLPVPTTPGLFGLEIALQAASLEGPTATLSNALSVVLGP